VLVYPSGQRGERDAFEEARLRASNASLEAQLRALEDISQQHVCRVRDTPVPVPWLKDSDSSKASDSRMDPIPRAPENVPLPRAADGNPGNAGNIGELLDRATVLVFGLKPPQDAMQGTGFFISDRYIVTNHHVVLGVGEGNIFISSRALGGIRRAHLIAKSNPPPSQDEIRADFAVLEVAPIANNASLRLGVTPPKLSTAYIAGFPGFITQRDLDFKNFITKLSDSLRAGNSDEMLSQQRVAVPSAELKYGRVNNVISTGRNALPVIIHDMQLAQGNSGGPLIDACGRLGGVNTLLFTNGEGAQQANVAQDVSLLRKFLTENKIPFLSDDSPCNPEAVRDSDRAGTEPPKPGGLQPAAPPAGSK
jgi:S1-C subfamily serine protease